jgi:hypothetical protein
MCLTAQTANPSAATTPQQQLLRFRKEKQLLFFQAGAASDTIGRNYGDLFYLVVPDSLKDMVYIGVENGRLTGTASDSLVRLHFMPGVAYESRYYQSDKSWELKSLINGATELQRDMVRIIVYHRLRGRMIENRFIYEER